MVNDRPTTLRMDFGGKRAFEAGMTEFSVPTTTDMNAKRRWQGDVKKLRTFLEENPSLVPAFLKILKEHKAKYPFGPIPSAILSQLRRPIPDPLKSRIQRRGF